jgi:oligopeptide/dipeptide ABC transporter ATP-binding protein
MNSILEVKNLKKYFPITKGIILKQIIGQVRAVDDISFKINEGKVLGLIGESGSGKTTTGKLVLGLLTPTGGKVIFNGEDLTKLDKKEMKEARKKMVMIFQDPTTSFNPRLTAETIITEPINIHKTMDRVEARERAIELLREVGLSSEHLSRFPHEFSGGQLQRIAIARALSLNPKLIVADEPTSALDVSVQAQVLNLLQELKESYNLSFLFISHDLSTVKYMSDKVGIMYLGKLLELSETDSLFDNPQHPYTKALLEVVPIPNPREMKAKMKNILGGEIFTLYTKIKGCVFSQRCPNATNICSEIEPQMKLVKKDHYLACHLN